MPLLDHFHPPLNDELPWSSIGTLWVAKLVEWLNRTLPLDEYRAFANVRLGSQAEADVAEYETPGKATGRNGSVLTLPEAPPAVATVDAIFPEEYEVQITERRKSLHLAAVIEFVSPANKKEADERQAFLAKCVSYLRLGVGVVVVDIVTERRTNFHNELMDLVGGEKAPRLPKAASTYVSGYRPVHRKKRNLLDLWPAAAPVGQPLPSVPLAIRGGPLLMLDLEASYTDTLRAHGV
jgi:hypothetical protein